MDLQKEIYGKTEQPLESVVQSYSFTSFFRKIAFVGDSLSSGEFETCDKEGNRGYHDMYEHSWGQYIARQNGLIAYNFSRGGMSAKQYMQDFAEERGFWNKDKACQAYVIALGVNDLLCQGQPIGSADDIDVNDYRNNKETFAGFYGQIISRYKEISPDSKFFLVTFPKDSAQAAEKLLPMVNLMYDIAEKFENCYVIDLYKYGPEYDAEFKKNFYLHGHLNPMGYILTAKIIDSYIDYIIRHNPKDFENAGFINSGIPY